MNDDDALDRTSHPELTGLFDALDGLANAPADPVVRAEQIQRAALAARTAVPDAAVPIRWGWRRAVSWPAAAAAAAVIAIVAGLGVDDRLPAPAQRVVSSVADAVGIEVPDGSTRTPAVGDEDSEGSPNRSGTTPATPADPGSPGEPATPATPATPGNDGNADRDENENGRPEGEEPGADPATPADPGATGEPATPAVPSEGSGNDNGEDDGKSQRPAEPPAESKADPEGKADGRD